MVGKSSNELEVLASNRLGPYPIQSASGWCRVSRVLPMINCKGVRRVPSHKKKGHYCKRSGFGNNTVVTVSNVVFTVKNVI